MAFFDTTWYINAGDMSSTGFYAMAQWTANTVYSAGQMVRGLAAPSSGNERARICIVGGTSHATTEPTWTNTRGAKNTDNTVTWQECTGASAVNGDVTNTPNWTTVKNASVTLGQIIKSDAATHFFICSTAGTTGNGSEPTWGTTAGNTTADNTVTWTCIGAVGSFTGWQAPHVHTQKAYATNWGAAGDTFYVASEHAAVSNLNGSEYPPSTVSNPSYVYCVTKTNIPPTSSNLTTGATIVATAENINFSSSAFCHIQGISYTAGFSSGTVNVSTAGTSTEASFENCALKKTGTSSSQAIVFGTTTLGISCKIKLKNTTLQVGSLGDQVSVYSDLTWQDTPNAITGSIIPTTLFAATVSNGLNGDVLLEGVDLSALGSGKTIVGALHSPRSVILKDCNLNASVTIAATPPAPGGVETIVIRSDSTGTNYNHAVYKYAGTQIVETIIIHTNGASDGTTGLSWKITTGANTKWKFPFELMPIVIWNDTTASNISATLEGVWNAAALPNNDDFWFDMEYLGSSSSPLGSFKGGSKADVLATGTALTASTEAWDSLVTSRANSTAYSVGDVRKVASNPGRIFFCTTAGTTSGSEPAGYASAVDGGSVTDNTAVFRAAVRFKHTVTISSPQPAQKGYVYLYPKVGKASTTMYIDPKAAMA